MSTVELSVEERQRISEIAQQVRLAEQTVAEAYALRQEVVRALHAAGLKVYQIAPLVGVGPQRVSKIIDGNAKPTLRKKRQPPSPVKGDGSAPAEWFRPSEGPAGPGAA